MGGSRCAYRNCSVRTDGVVHMFHYPAYDKLRCHQWIVNTNRLDFLNLKLSQVRNRVVCQHHFRDECFMNYLKEKLTFDAIPTEDGPYCDKSKHKDVLPIEQTAKPYSVAILDVDENDKYSKSNKKAKSIIYADFLTNGDVWEKQCLNETIWNNMVINAKETIDDEKDVIVKHGGDKKTKQKSKPSITLTDLIEDASNTKITEFENLLLANIDLNQNKEVMVENSEVMVENNEIKSYQKSQKCQQSVSSIENPDISSLITKQEPTNVVVCQDNNFMLSNPNLDNLFSSQDTKLTFDTLAMPNNNTVEKKIDIEINTNENIDTFIDKNKIPQIDQSMQIVTSTSDYCAIIQNPIELAMQVQSNVNNVKYDEQSGNYINIDQWKANQVQNYPQNSNIIKKPKVTILSEKRIVDPVLINGQLEPVSPTAYIHLPKKAIIKPVSNYEVKIENNIPNESITVNQNIVPVKDVAIQNDNNTSSVVKTPVKKNTCCKLNKVPPKPSVIKYKIAPERVAAIEKKRNFNKRLRDIIEICLDKLDDQDKANEEVKVADPPKVIFETNKASIMKENVANYLSKHTDLPSPQEYMMKFLETRMKKMEDILLDKIEQNTKRIVELKNVISQSPRPIKATGTQTNHDQESFKNQLYQEISQFLSPSASSLVYEELFINKYGQKLSNQPSSPKRRKRR